MPLRQDVAASVLSIEIAFDYLIFVESQGRNCRFVFLELTSCMISLDLTGPLSGPGRRRWTPLRPLQTSLDPSQAPPDVAGPLSDPARPRWTPLGPSQTLLDPSQTQSDHIFEIIC